MIIGIVKESTSGEQRVAATLDSVKKLIGLGYEVQVEASCGAAANFSDPQYAAAGASIAGSRVDPRNRRVIAPSWHPDTICDSSGCGTTARSHECLTGRGTRALRRRAGDGRNQ